PSTTMNNLVASTKAPGRPRLFTTAWSLCLLALLFVWAGLWVSHAPGWSLTETSWSALPRWGRLHLPPVTDGSSYLFILCPPVLMCAWSVSMLLTYKQPPD